MLDYSVIIKLTTRCNLRCEYCNVEEKGGMDFPIEDVDCLIDWLDYTESSDKCSVLWHGGEPLLLGYDYFDRLFTSQSRYPNRFINSISTNGILIDDKLINLFLANDVTIKTSLDSLETSYDQQRNFSSQKVLSTLYKLKEYDYKNIYVRTTVSKYNQKHLFDIYRFMHTEFDFIWEFAPIIPAGLKKDEAYALLPDAQIFNNEVISIFKHWFEFRPIEIPIFTDLIKVNLGFLKTPEISEPRLNVGQDGIIYRCPLLMGNHEYEIGHFTDKSAFEQYCSLQCIWEKIDKAECYDCLFNNICRLSNCAYLAVSLSGMAEIPDYYCQLWKPIYREIRTTVNLATCAAKIHDC